MAVQTPPPEKSSAWRMVSMASFAFTVALFTFVSSRCGMRWLGLVMLVAGVVHIAQRRIAYGWEGRAPSGHITGVPAVVLGVLMGALGVAMLAQPDLMLAVFGWDSQ